MARRKTTRDLEKELDALRNEVADLRAAQKQAESKGIVEQLRTLNSILQRIENQKPLIHPNVKALWGPYPVGYLKQFFPEIHGCENDDHARKKLLKLRGIKTAGRGKKGVLIEAWICRQRGIPPVLTVESP